MPATQGFSPGLKDFVGYTLVVLIPVAIIVAVVAGRQAAIWAVLIVLVAYPLRVWVRRHKKGRSPS